MAKDIESMVKSASSDHSGNNLHDISTLERILSVAAQRGRRLLRYAKDNDRTSSLFDMAVARKLSSIQFVPVTRPRSSEIGGHVNWMQGVGCFNETIR